MKFSTVNVKGATAIAARDELDAYGQSESWAEGRVGKRAFDVVFAAAVLIATLPLLMVIYVLLRLKSPGPAIFAHERVGLYGKSFKCLKFRTMYLDSDEMLEEHLRDNPEAAAEFKADRKIKNDPRVIQGIGKFLRKSSLDELPQFANVLMGDMSVVGPRPVTQEEILEGYGTHASEVLSVRPGVTGLWQVSGRNSVSYNERVSLDTMYIRTRSFALDISIVLKTVGVVLSCRGAS